MGKAMSKTRDAVTIRIYAALDAYERATDLAAAAGADLAAELPRARLEGRFAAEVGQEAYEHFISSLGKIVQARGLVVEGHKALAAVRDEWRLPVVSYGDKGPMPEEGLLNDEKVRPLRAA